MIHFAFLTPEFPTNSPSSGGLATFAGRITRSLVAKGYCVDVFLPAESPSTEDWFGVNVFNVQIPPYQASLWNRGPGSWWGRISSEGLERTLHSARFLANALEKKHAVDAYNYVHGADFGLTTYFVRPAPNRRVVVRASSRSELCRHWMGSSNRLEHFLLTRAEHRLFRQADLAYAPSECTAKFYWERAGVDMKVIRPPVEISFDSAAQLDFDLPHRFLLHFGNINRVKGSDWLARALAIAWKSAPDLQMVWAGTDLQGWLPRFQLRWGSHASKVTWLGPIPRTQIRSIVRKAVAVVSPSRVDNLPNTVLEAQADRIPVIGTWSSSIDEIVVDSVTGKLVEIDDDNSLAEAMISAWKGYPPFNSQCPIPPIFDLLKPELAVQNLLDYINATKAAPKTGGELRASV